MPNLQYAPDGTSHATRADYDLYYAANAASLDALVAARDAANAPDPIPTVATQYADAKAYAESALNTLMATVSVAMAGAGMDRDTANAAGSAFVVQHASLIFAWQQCGTNHVAGQALLAAITADPPAWWSEPIAAIFAEALA